jgi:hypothetical protein
MTDKKKDSKKDSKKDKKDDKSEETPEQQREREEEMGSVSIGADTTAGADAEQAGEGTVTGGGGAAGRTSGN